MKVAIGIPTYRDHKRITNLITSIYTLTKFEGGYKIVMLDDGTKDEKHVDKLKELSEQCDIPLIINSENKGIPYSWNRLTEYYDDAEYMVLFNDDIQVCSSRWLEALIYFIESNNNIGVVGWPITHINPLTSMPNSRYNKPNESNPPGRVGAPVGCCFGFKREIWKKVKQPDGSIGFYESIKSFYEEIDFSFEVWKLGYSNYMLSYPCLEHWGSQTFANNPELSHCELTNILSKEEYIDIMKKAPTSLPIPIERHIELANKYNKAYRMDYARCIFSKKWGCTDFWNTPQVEVHQRYVNNNKVKIKWIDNNNEFKEEIL